LKRGEEALEAAIPSEADTPVVLRSIYGVRTKGEESYLLKYYAKSYLSPLPGGWKKVGDIDRLSLEIVPLLESDGVKLHVLWKGEPLPKAQVVASGPGLKDRWEAETDENGTCLCPVHATGLYSIRTKHVEVVAGEHDGKKYTEVRNYSTLSLRYEPQRIQSTSAQLPELPEGLTSFGAAILDDALYLYGGNYGSAHDYSNADQSGDLWRLSLSSPHKWEKVLEGPKLQGLALVSFRGALYRLGGFTAVNAAGKDADLRSQAGFARWAPSSTKWEQLPPLPEPRSSFDATLLGSVLYVAGGWNLQGDSRQGLWHETAWSIDLATEMPQWKALANPPFKRRALALAAYGGRVYCIGGMQPNSRTTTSVAVYNPDENRWTEGGSLLGAPLDGFGASACECEGGLYVSTMSGSIQRLAPDGRGWEFVAQTKHPRFFHRMISWQDQRMVLVGGASMSAGKILPVDIWSAKPLDVSAKP
jgi:N-acetylneuraminic acid mutarotase